MRKSIFISLFLTFFYSGSTAQTGIIIPELAAFDNAMLNLLSTYNVPGAQLAISYQGRLVYNRGFGFANTATQDSVYPTNIFRIASVSKPITSIACFKLFEQGLLNLDSKVFGVNGILNDEIYLNILDARDTSITVRMLLQHSGGWNRDLSGDPMFNAYQIATAMGVSSPPSASDVIQYVLSQKTLDFTPGTESQYSNFGFCVLGRVIEKITGQNYASYVQNNILLPLGISNMNIGKNLLIDQLPNEVNYYDFPGASQAYSIYNNSSLVPWQYGGFNLEFMDSHGGWVASCQDLLKLVCAFDRFDTRPDILTTATIDTLTKSSFNDPNYACGIAVNNFNNWWHMGSLPGTTSEIVRAGNSQLNWAILLNTRDQIGNINSAVDNLVWSVLPSISNWPAIDLFDSPASIIFNVSTSVEPIAGGSVAGAGSYPAGSIVSLTATANENYEFLKWKANGIEVSTANPYLFTINETKTLVAEFEIQADLPIIKETNNSITIFPNPTSNKVNFSKKTNARFINLAGQVVLYQKNIDSIEIKEQDAGIYFIELLDDTEQVIQRVKIIKKNL